MNGDERTTNVSQTTRRTSSPNGVKHTVAWDRLVSATACCAAGRGTTTIRTTSGARTATTTTLRTATTTTVFVVPAHQTPEPGRPRTARASRLEFKPVPGRTGGQIPNSQGKAGSRSANAFPGSDRSVYPQIPQIVASSRIMDQGENLRNLRNLRMKTERESESADRKERRR
jgi:hypothetical protein